LSNLPTDYPRPEVQSFEGATVNFTLGEEVVSKLKAMATEQGLTLYMLLLSAYTLLLSKLSGQTDIVVGTPIAGRRHVDLERIVGMFVNVLPMRTTVSSVSPVKNLLEDIRQTALEAYDHQEYPFENLVERVSVVRDVSRNPLFDVMFNMLNHTEYSGELMGLNSEVHTSGISKFDLTLTVVDFGNQLLMSFEYCTKLFKPETIDHFIGYFKHVLNILPGLVNDNISVVDLISENEKQKLIIEFNNTKVDYPKGKTIQQLFEEQVTEYPDRIALVHGEEQLTYSELNNIADLMSMRLIEAGVKPFSIVGLLVERTPEMIIGTLSILKCSCTYLPLDTGYPKNRLEYMIKDCNVTVVISGKDLGVDISELCSMISISDYLNVRSGLLKKSKEHNPYAYIMYTSGSTGKPKGVLVKQQGVVRLVKNANYVPLSPDTIILQAGAIVFDATTFEIWGALLNGGKLILEDKENILSASKLRVTLQKQNVNTLLLSTSLFNQLIQEDADIFRCVKWLMSGGEVMSPRHVLQLQTKNLDLSLINVYGPTENSTFSTTFQLSDKVETSIPIGKPVNNSTCYIVGKDKQLQPIHVVGELYVGGDGLAAGYLNNPELTNERFLDNVLGNGEMLYRSGDLSRWLPDGNIAFMGRVDQQVKLRGFRIELGEIENVLVQYEGVKECTVLLYEKDGEKFVCAYIVLYNVVDFTVQLLREYMVGLLPEYMIPSYFIPIEKIPLSTNGKLDRKALPLPEVIASSNYVAPANEIEERLVEIWSEILKIPQREISTDVNFFEIGGHSLKATVLVSKIHRVIGVRLSLREVFQLTKIREQAIRIGRSSGDTFSSILQAQVQDCYPLSSAQRRLYLLQEMYPNSTAYNMPYIIPLGTIVDIGRIEETFHLLIQRHESFRTSFVVVGEEPRQIIHPEVAFKVHEYRVSQSDESSIKEKFIQPFNLTKAPLIRVALVTIENSESVLMVDMHHIISDGVSQGILEREFRSLYSGEELSPLRVQYKDYCGWQNDEEHKQKKKIQEAYWLKKFEGDIAILNLPTDYVRPAIQTYDGASLSFNLSKEDTEILKSFSNDHGLTLYMSFIAVFTILLSKLSGQEDIVVGTPIAGRNHIELEQIVGVFVNTLAIRIGVKGEMTITELFEEVKQTALEAFENQDYQFEDLVEKLSLPRDLSRNPVIDVMFNMLNIGEYKGDLVASETLQRTHTPGLSKFDLSLSAVDYGEQIQLNLNYSTQLFKADTIERYVGFLQRIINQLHNKQERNISEIEIISEEEKQHLLYEFNNTINEYPKDKTIHQLFEEQVERTPDRLAVVYNNQSITYRELNLRSNQLGCLLLERGLAPNSIVGVLMDRCIEMIIGIFGILKSGGVYLPMDIESPLDRINYIINDSEMRIILSQDSELRRGEFNAELLDLFDLSIYSGFQTHTPLFVKSGKLAYVIYTSGSTGKPKGVMIGHQSLVNLVYGLTSNIYQNYHETLHVSLISPIFFDASVKQIFPTLTLGHNLMIIPASIRFEAQELISYYSKHAVQIVDGTPFHAQILLQGETRKMQNLSIKQLILGGDELKRELIEELFQKFKLKNLRVSNVYGPTECTDVTTVYTTTIDSLKQESNGLIGQPISNYSVYILDKSDNIQPIGVPGELCISNSSEVHGSSF